MIGAAVISFVWSTLAIRRLQVRRIDPRNGVVGEALVVRYEVTNRSRWLPIFNVHIEDRPAGADQPWQRLMRPARAWVMHVGPGETVHGEATYWPRQRGRANFSHMSVWTTFPFGFLRRSATREHEQHTFVYPRQYELKRGILHSLTPIGLMGQRIAQRQGPGDDYFGLREYKPGDSFRHIAWKRTAKLDDLVCVERTMPSPPKMRVILDLTTPTRELQHESRKLSARRAMEERAISLAASLLRAADHEDFEVGLAVLGFDMPEIPLRHNRWHLSKIMAALAAIDLDSPRTAAVRLDRYDDERAGLVVVSPDRVGMIGRREDAWYLTSRQLSELAVQPIGWDGDADAPSSNGFGRVPDAPRRSQTSPAQEKAA